ncbi:MAG TPA: PIN domain-containing protein [Azospirillum sp.]|nr:PIN domain-containing protein [Azospirillum sp.]
MRFTLDANVLCYAFDPREASRRARAIDLIGRARSADCVLTLQALGEFYAVSTRKFALPRDEAHAHVEDLHRSFAVQAADVDCLTTAIAANREHGVPFWDALLWATAQKAGCTLLLSEDGQDNRRLGDILILNPFNEANRELLDAALSPTD